MEIQYGASPLPPPTLSMSVAVLIRILELVHEALVDNKITTKRFSSSIKTRGAGIAYLLFSLY